MSPLAWILCVFASARTYRLASIDEAGFYFRNVVYRLPEVFHRWLTCPFCSGWWYALGWVLTGLAWGDTVVWQALAGSLAVNWIAAQFGAWLDIKVIHDGGGEIAAEEGE